jgi:NAD(P)-dependent dehydrogenase (short-subunit alcohol dehydrogenase family)
VSKEEDVKNYVQTTVDKFGSIDIFFNNAGILGKVGLTVEQKVEDFDKVMDVNVRGVFLGLKYVLEVMEKQQSGSIINTSSIDGLHASPHRIHYGAAKHAVVGMTKTTAIEMADKGVRVNSIHPGYANTSMMRDSEAGVNPDDPESVKEEFTGNIPLGRYGEPEDIANLVLFLGSDESSFITGTQQRVDGGIGAK